MMRKVPIIRPAVPLRQVCSALAGSASGEGNPAARFERKLAGSLPGRFVHTADSGLTAFYCILQALKQMSSADEVVLPAYTAGSLIVAVRAAGLKPVLCDVSLDDFNMDLRLLPACLSPRTLAVVAVHMFGIPQKGIAGLRSILPADVLLIEDCCQAMGSTIQSRPVGSFSDISFYSFNRGKNTTLFGGGAVVTDNPALERLIAEQYAQLKPGSFPGELAAAVRMLFSPVVTWPPAYGLVSALVSGLRENAPPAGLSLGALGRLQAVLGTLSAGDWQRSALGRQRNGMFLAGALEHAAAVQLPRITPDMQPAFNRFPLLCADAPAAERLAAALWQAGIESSRMYLRPLHLMFDLGVSRSSLPRSEELAQRLLTLPVYPALGEKDLQTMIEVIRQ